MQNKNKSFKRVISLVLAFVMLLTTLPYSITEALASTTASGQIEITNGSKYKTTWNYITGVSGSLNGSGKIYSFSLSNIGQSSTKTVDMLIKSVSVSNSGNVKPSSSDIPAYRLSRSYGYSDVITSATAVTTVDVNTNYQQLKDAAQKDGISLSQQQTLMIQLVLKYGCKQFTATSGSTYYNEELFFLATQSLIWEISEGKRTGWGNSTTWCDTERSDYKSATASDYDNLRNTSIRNAYGNTSSITGVPYNLRFYWHDYYYSMRYRCFSTGSSYAERMANLPTDYYQQILTNCYNNYEKFKVKLATASSYSEFIKTEYKDDANATKTFKMTYYKDSDNYTSSQYNGYYMVQLDFDSTFLGSGMGQYDVNKIIVPVNYGVKDTSGYTNLMKQKNVDVNVYYAPNEYSAIKQTYSATSGKSFYVTGETVDGNYYMVEYTSGGENTYGFVLVSDLQKTNASSKVYRNMSDVKLVSGTTNRIQFKIAASAMSEGTITCYWYRNSPECYNNATYFTASNTSTACQGWLIGGKTSREVVTLKFTMPSNTVTYNCSMCSTKQSIKVPNGYTLTSNDVKLSSHTHSGYTFTGWTKNDSTSLLSTPAKQKIAENTTFTRNYKEIVKDRTITIKCTACPYSEDYQTVWSTTTKSDAVVTIPSVAELTEGSTHNHSNSVSYAYLSTSSDGTDSGITPESTYLNSELEEVYYIIYTDAPVEETSKKTITIKCTACPYSDDYQTIWTATTDSNADVLIPSSAALTSKSLHSHSENVKYAYLSTSPTGEDSGIELGTTYNVSELSDVYYMIYNASDTVTVTYVCDYCGSTVSSSNGTSNSTYTMTMTALTEAIHVKYRHEALNMESTGFSVNGQFVDWADVSDDYTVTYPEKDTTEYVYHNIYNNITVTATTPYYRNSYNRTYYKIWENNTNNWGLSIDGENFASDDISLAAGDSTGQLNAVAKSDDLLVDDIEKEIIITAPTDFVITRYTITDANTQKKESHSVNNLKTLNISTLISATTGSDIKVTFEVDENKYTEKTTVKTIFADRYEDDYFNDTEADMSTYVADTDLQYDLYQTVDDESILVDSISYSDFNSLLKELNENVEESATKSIDFRSSEGYKYTLSVTRCAQGAYYVPNGTGAPATSNDAEGSFAQRFNISITIYADNPADSIKISYNDTFKDSQTGLMFNGYANCYSYKKNFSTSGTLVSVISNETLLSFPTGGMCYTLYSDNISEYDISYLALDYDTNEEISRYTNTIETNYTSYNILDLSSNIDFNELKSLGYTHFLVEYYPTKSLNTSKWFSYEDITNAFDNNNENILLNNNVIYSQIIKLNEDNFKNITIKNSLTDYAAYIVVRLIKDDSTDYDGYTKINIYCTSDAYNLEDDINPLDYTNQYYALIFDTPDEEIDMNSFKNSDIDISAIDNGDITSFSGIDFVDELNEEFNYYVLQKNKGLDPNYPIDEYPYVVTYTLPAGMFGEGDEDYEPFFFYFELVNYTSNKYTYTPSIQGGDYIPNNTDYQYTYNFVCDVNVDSIDITAEFVEPNVSYNYGEYVVASYLVTNLSDFAFTDSNPLTANLSLTVNYVDSYGNTKSSVLGSAYQCSKELVLPNGEGSQNIVYFVVKLPTYTYLTNYWGLKNCTINSITPTLRLTYKDGDNFVVAKATGTVPIESSTTSSTVRPGFDLYGGKSFTYQAPTLDQDYANVASWQEYVCEDGEFKLLTNTAKIEFENNYLYPSSVTPSKEVLEDGDGNYYWQTKSGYSVTLSTTAKVTVSSDSETIANSSCTSIQSANAYYPENNYSKDNSLFDTLKLDNNTNSPISISSSSTFKIFQAGLSVHYTPMWYPDGDYIVHTYVSRCWTPCGMLSYLGDTNTVNISGSLFDDYKTSERTY